MMAEAKKVRIKLVKSPIGYRQSQKDTLRALGLRKLHATREVVLTPHMRGMINRVSHLLTVEELEG